MKKIISIILIAAIITAGFTVFGTIAGATTYITYGDWLLALNSNNTYLVGGYNGSENELNMPVTANNKAIVGVAEDFSDKCESQLTSVNMPDSYTTIESFAFMGCADLETVNFPSSLTNLGAMAFHSCTALEAVDLSESANLLSIPYSCFSGCSKIVSVMLPESLTSLGDYCFQSCTTLEQVSVPNGVKSVGPCAFYECTSLENVELPNGLEEIGENAFYNDSALTSIYIPVSVSSIGANAFFPMAIEGGTLTIDCHADTYAANYAYDNFLNYTGNIPLIKGDANNDGKVNIRDVTYIQLYRVGRYEIGTDAKTIDRVDVTGDYKVNISDATQIQLYRVGLADLV